MEARKNMGCKRTEKLLYLYREDELTPRQSKRLSKHLDQCAACSELRHRLECMDTDLLEKIRDLDLQSADPERLTDRIVRAFSGQPERKRILYGISVRKAASFPSAIGSRLRWGIPALSALLIILTFFVQEIQVWRRVAALEEQIARSSYVTRGADALKILRSRWAGRSAFSEDALRMREEIQDVLDLNEEWVLIRRERLSDLLNRVEVLEKDAGSFHRGIWERERIQRLLDAIEAGNTGVVRRLFDSKEAFRRLLKLL